MRTKLFLFLGDATSLESSGGYSASNSRGINTSSGNQITLKPGELVYATSLPVPVPLFNNTRNSYDPEIDDDPVSFFCNCYGILPTLRVLSLLSSEGSFLMTGWYCHPFLATKSALVVLIS